MRKPILTVLIVDDEHTARYGMRSYINKTPFLRCVGEFKDIMSLKVYLRDNIAPDIILMDIHMPEVSGLEFIASKIIDSAIIVVTAYEEYALKGFELNVCDYLLKPVSYKRFLQAVEKTSEYVYFHRGLLENNFVFLKADRMIYRIAISNIEYIESMENYVKVVTLDEKIVTRSTFKEILDSWAPKGIIQTHRSYAVNVGRIKKIDRSEISTESGHILPLSKTYRDKLLNYINFKSEI